MRPFDEHDDYDLIDWVGFSDEYPDEARTACGIIFTRYSKPLFKLLRRILSKRGIDDEGIEDLVQDTFYKIYSQKKTCKRSDSTTDKSFLYWLAKIAENIYKDGVRERDRSFVLRPVRLSEEETTPAAYDPNAEEIIFPNEEMVVEYVQGLDAKKREILLAYFDYHEPGKNSHTPPKVLAELAERFNTSTDYVRNIKNRTIDGLKKELSAKVLKSTKKLS